MSRYPQTGGSSTGASDGNDYYGVVNIDTAGTAFLLGHINDVEMDDADVGSDYLHCFIKDDIYTVGGPDFD